MTTPRKQPVYLYIPGLGDRFDPLRSLLLRRWGDVRIIPMHWSDKAETYEQKCARVSRAITRNEGKTIILVGESAGAATALAVFTRHKRNVSEVITICGFNRGAEAIHPIRRWRNPALYDMSRASEAALKRLPATDRQRITTIYSIHDRIVEAKYSHIDDAHSINLRTFGHMLSIIYVLLKTPSNLRKQTD